MPWLTNGFPSLYYELSGSGSRSLILCHELGGSLESFRSVVSRLSPHFRILSWDQRGAGLSEKPVSAYAMEAHADDLGRLIEAAQLPPPYLLCGVAAGAAVALLFAERQHRDAIEGAVLCSPSMGVNRERRDYLLGRSALARIEGMSAVVDAVLALSFPKEIFGMSHDYLDYRARFLSNDPVGYALANEAFSAFELGDRLGAIRYPVHFLAGDDDRLRPPALVAGLAELVPGATLSVVKSGHLMSIQAPDAVADAVRRMSMASQSG